MDSIWVFLSLILILVIFIIVYSNNDIEALVISGFIVSAYFFLKFIIYIIICLDSEKLMDNLSSDFQTFLRYLSACLVFTLIFIIAYPFIKKR